MENSEQPIGLKNGNKPAYPSKFTYGDKDEFGAPVIAERVSYGLTKREYFAAMAMQGLCVGTITSKITKGECVDIAEISVIIADQLLKELETTPPGNKKE